MVLGRYGFTLIALVALAAGCADDGVQKVVPERQGSRGESCLITNDCKSGLLCIANTCISDDFALEASAKVCVVAQCIDKTDCCKPKSPTQMMNCQTLQTQCAANPGSFACDSYESSCGECKIDCIDHSCKSTAPVTPECATDDECFGGQRCIAGECSNCGTDAECGTGFICNNGNCTTAQCLRDEACGALSKCNAGRCEDRACASDRECVAFMDRPDGVCNMTSGQCSIPCEDNASCASLGGLFSCVEGACVYAGCLTNAECAAGSQGGVGGGILRLCLDKAEADKVTFGGNNLNF